MSIVEFAKEIENMEDRYLYKAKRIDNGEWVQGYLYSIWEKRYILWGMTNDVPDMIEVEPSTICQCTGLKDDNGNLIYENDILFLKDEINGCKWKAVVEFGNPTGEYNWGWQLVQVTECEANKDILLWIETEMSYMDAKIIGNTIDNLELVESEE
jgi:uncharacterized phage protein (TIGR01671 family)